MLGLPTVDARVATSTCGWSLQLEKKLAWSHAYALVGNSTSQVMSVKSSNEPQWSLFKQSKWHGTGPSSLTHGKAFLCRGSCLLFSMSFKQIVLVSASKIKVRTK